MADQSFRLVERRSMLRANIFLLECAAVLALQLAALQRYVAPGPQRLLLAVFAAVYMARLNVMARWLLPRELATEELTIVALVWVPMILASYTYGAALHQPTNAQLLAAAAAYVGGSFLNSFSELQRKWWKARPENKGRCYTLGLFSLARNINYFGDVVLFGGWALATGAWWNAWAPVTMFLSFHFYHVPDKEEYLAKRYEKDWPAYRASTKSMIPWVL